MALLTDEDLMPWWIREGFDCPPWEAQTEVPEIPSWLMDAPGSVEEPGCDCGHPKAGVEEPVRWAIPGVWGDDPPVPVRPVLGPAVTRLQETVARLREVDPSALPAGQALAEAEVLLGVEQELRVLGLARTRDVSSRQLFTLAGYRGTTAWRRTVAPDAADADRTLANQLPRWPHLHSAVLEGHVPLAGAVKVKNALGKVRRYLDPADGLIEGQPAENVIGAVVEQVVELVAKDRFGLEDRAEVDPAPAAVLATLEADVARIQDSGGSQRDRVEQAMVLVATHVHPSRLDRGLEDLVLAIVPSMLEEQDKAAQDNRELALTPRADGMWDVRGRLTSEVGEQLVTALAAEARRDPANPEDTAVRAARRAEAAEAAGGDGWADAAAPEPWETNPDLLSPDGDQLLPRTPSKRLHDALGRLLTRYLSSGLGGVHGKIPVQLTATISERTLTNTPGAPPARGGSGRPLARSLLRRWWCDAQVTTLLMSRGWKPLGVVHTARTVTGTELRAVQVQFDSRCPGLGCCPGQPSPLIPLVPHHVKKHALFGRTSIDETLLVCERLHADIHTGKRTIRLRDGRLISEDGWLLDND